MTAGERGRAIVMDGLAVGYDGVPVLSGLTGYVPEGELLALIGPNGGGKSTLMRTIAGELRPLAGKVALGGAASGGVAHLRQRPDIDRTFPITVADVLAMGLWRRIGAFRALRELERDRIEAALVAIGLEGEGRRQIGSLSGGQLQRVLFGRALLQDASLILLDEPFEAVDEPTSEALFRLVLGWVREGRTVLVALHDAAQVRTHFSSAMLLAGRLIAWGHPGEVLTPDNVAAASHGHGGGHHRHGAEMIGGHGHP